MMFCWLPRSLSTFPKKVLSSLLDDVWFFWTCFDSFVRIKSASFERFECASSDILMVKTIDGSEVEGKGKLDLKERLRQTKARMVDVKGPKLAEKEILRENELTQQLEKEIWPVKKSKQALDANAKGKAEPKASPMTGNQSLCPPCIFDIRAVPS